MMSLPSMALATQMRLADEYATAFGQDYLRNLGRLVIEQAAEVSGDQEFHTHAEQLAEVSPRLVRQVLVHGDTYALSAEILESLEQAAPLLPEDAYLNPRDVPSQSGFVYLERPLPMIDVKGSTVVVHAIGWVLTFARDKVNVVQIGRDDPVEREYTVLLAMLFTDVHDPRDHLHDQRIEIPFKYLMMWGPSIDFYTPLAMQTRHNWSDADGTFERVLLAFFRFINEPWIDDRMMVPGRALMRQADRKLGSGRDHRVRVIQLRKATTRPHRDGPSMPREWSHRWLVKGHWRNQWYPSEQRHALKWIPTHIKGPDDKELFLHDRVFHVER